MSYPFTLINADSAAMIGVGSASVLSRAIGKKDQDTVKKIMGNLITVVLLMSMVYMVIGMVFTRQLLTLAGASDNILTYAEKYLRIVFAGSLFVNFFQSANMVIRGEGQLKKAKETIERVFADAKEKHAMRYTFYRGLAQVSNWVRLKFAAMNLKKLAR